LSVVLIFFKQNTKSTKVWMYCDFLSNVLEVIKVIA